MSDAFMGRRGTVAAVCFAVAVAVYAFAGSDNVHSTAESVSFDRLMLGLRWLDPATPTRWDPNFPLGTAVLMALPHALGLDPVAWGRGLSLVGAVVATWFGWAVVRRVSSPPFAAWFVVALWCVPAFVRGAVVVGEESLFAAFSLGTLWALVRAETDRRFFWLAVLGANATVLVRIDAMAILPGFVLAAWCVGGVRRAAVFAVLSGGSTLVHFLVGWRGQGGWNGDPLGFARVARETIARSGGGPGDAWRLATELAGELWMIAPLGGLVLAALVAALVRLWRVGDAQQRALALAGAWMLLASAAAAGAGALEPSIHRYWVPLLAVLLLVAACALGTVRQQTGRRVAALLAALLCANLWTIAEQVREARLPDGLAEAARELGRRAGEERVLVAEQHPTVVVLSGLDWRQVDVLPAGHPRENRERVVRQAVTQSRARWLLQVGDNPPAGPLRAVSEPPPVYTSACCAIWEL